MDIRRLTLDDHVPSYRLGAEAFGGGSYSSTVPDPPATLPEGRDMWGAFDGEEMVARVAAHEYESWWHGRRVATCGIAGVAVAPERRGGGVLRPVFAAALDAAAERGEALSTLYPTANGIYRSFGYELVTSYDTVEVPVAELSRVRPPEATRTRRAVAADVPAVHHVYDVWAAAQNGPLTRTGPRFAETPDDFLGDVTAVTLAVARSSDGDDEVVGFMTWDRGAGYDPGTSVLEVHDLVALSLDAYRALWTVLASYSSVVGRVRLHTSGDDPARLVLGTSTWQVVGRHPYMLKVSDPAGALTGLSCEPLRPAALGVRVVGDPFGRADGGYRLEHDGVTSCTRDDVGDDAPTLTTQGLAMLYAGAQSCANLRLVGHLTGPTTHDRQLDALLRSRPVHVRDYF